MWAFKAVRGQALSRPQENYIFHVHLFFRKMYARRIESALIFRPMKTRL